MGYRWQTSFTLCVTLAWAGCGDDASFARLGPMETPRSDGPAATSTAEGEFNIELRFSNAVSDQLRQGAERAARRWTEVIRNDLADTTVNNSDLPSSCRVEPEGGTTTVDDLIVLVRVIPIDGPRGTLAGAGPCVIRNSDLSPLFGVLRIDEDDAERIQDSPKLDGILLHEMGHVLGIGTLWGDFDLLRNPSLPDQPDADTHFDGPATHQAFVDVGGDRYRSGEPVPVENSGNGGSADGHWRESVFGEELMTPTLSGGERSLPLSVVTIASLEDLGIYTVDPGAADPYQLVAPTMVALRATSDPVREQMQLGTRATAPLMMAGCAVMHPVAAAAHNGSIHIWGPRR